MITEKQARIGRALILIVAGGLLSIKLPDARYTIGLAVGFLVSCLMVKR